MDNSTYDVLKLTPYTSNETYSALATVPTRDNQSYEARRKEDSDRSEISGGKQYDSTDVPNKTKLIVVLIIMTVILLLITLVSIALSITTYSRLISEQSTLQSQLNKANNDITSAVFTQLATTHSNTSQMLTKLDTKINDFISVQMQNTRMEPQSICGPGLWYRVAYLNMTDPSQQCPPAWREYNENGIRACGRLTVTGGSCATKCCLTSNQYSRVCGRVIGYQDSTPDAFNVQNNEIGLDGVTIIYGPQNHHVWSYVAGEQETSNSPSTCPCSHANDKARMSPQYIGDNYYCESGNPTNSNHNNQFLSEDKLWDGQECEHEGDCCNSTNSPPWFSVQLPAPTTDTIEVSICCDQDTSDEDTPVELIEIYVQ